MPPASIRDTFFQECEDLIVALSEGLAEMAEGQADSDTVNAVFRAVHSIKGAAAAFALSNLVGFAHTFEAVLDCVRSDTLTPDETVMRVLQRAGDILADLVDAARDETEHDADAVAAGAAALQELLGNAPAPMSDADFVFDAVGLDMALPDLGMISEPTSTTFRIRIIPRPDLFERGHEPLFLLAALQDLGTARITANAAALPISIDDFDWEKCGLSWDVELETDALPDKIGAVFEFVEGSCTVEIDDPSQVAVRLQQAGAVGGSDRVAALPDAASVGLPSGAIDASIRGTAPLVHRTPPMIGSAAAPPTPAKEKPATETNPTLRVDLDRVDRLINSVGELIINQAVIAQRIEIAGFLPTDDILLDLEDYKLLAREIQEGVMAIRAQPVKPLFQRMSRIVREAAGATAKKVQLVSVGEATEVDKTVVERLADPLTHMIRNAIDHGIECPDQRRAAGKNETGTIRLSAEHRSGNVLIEISDDGAGLNRPRIRQIAIEKGIVGAEAELSDSEIDTLLFAPGFSTATEVTNLSGRGVGMDVVKTAITQLGGRVTIASSHGKGTVFTISLPLTLAVMDGMIVNVGAQTMVVPIASILETMRPSQDEISAIGLNGPLLQVRGTFVPIIDLSESLGHGRMSGSLIDKVFLLVSTERMAQCALAVDGISDQRQVVIKSLRGNYGDIPGISAATILGDGKIALILDPDAIAAMAAQRGAVAVEPRAPQESSHA